MHQNINLAHDMKVVVLDGATIAGQGDVISPVIDMQGFESVALIAITGDVTVASVLTLTAQAGDESDGSDAADLAAAATFTADATSADEKALIVDLHRPRSQFVRAKLGRATANAAVNALLAVLYNAGSKPVTADATVVASVHVNDPAPA